MHREILVQTTQQLWQTSIDMNKKILIPIVTAVLILPALYFGGIVPMSVLTESFSPTYTQQELVERSDIVSQGELVKGKSFVEWTISGNNAIPSVYTNWSLHQSESIKGDNSKVIEFVVDGGIYNNIIQKAMHETKLNEGDNVIVFLSKDIDSIYKDNYYMTGIESGIYKIKDGVASNSYTKTSLDIDSFKSSLRSFN